MRYVFSEAGISLAALLLLPGCSCGDMGTVVSRSRITQRARIVESYSLGFSVSPHKDTRGITFGYHHAAYFFPPDGEKPARRWSFFYTPLPDRSPLAISYGCLGLGIGVNPFNSGFCIGWESVLGCQFPLDGSGWHLRISPSAPEETRIESFKPATS